MGCKRPQDKMTPPNVTPQQPHGMVYCDKVDKYKQMMYRNEQ